MITNKLKNFFKVLIALIFDRCSYCHEALEEHINGKFYCVGCNKLN